VRPASLRDRTAAGARAAILARLWGAVAREPIPGVVRRRVDSSLLWVELSDGSVLTGDAAAARPFAVTEPGFAVTLTSRTGVEVLAEPGDLIRAIAPVLGRHGARLADELDNSVANLALAREAEPRTGDADSLVHFEQSVVDGHPLHPCTRTRMGLSPDEVRAYAPEHHPVVMLRTIAVPPDRWYGSGRPLLVMHPWQHDRLCGTFPWLATVEGELPARPLMSLRTLAIAPDRHVKTAMDVQMTSAVRTVSAASIHNGERLSRLMMDEQGRVPGLDALPESGGAILVDGEADRRLAMTLRTVPVPAPGELVLPLAALAAPSAATGRPLVTELDHDPLAVVTGLASALLPPVLAWLDLGVALEAHGQNVLGVTTDGRFSRLLYRDFGGVRVSARRLRERGIEPPPLLGDVPSDDPDVLRTKVLASAVATVLGEVIAVLTRHGLDEQKAWGRVAAVARGLPNADGLFAETLPLKAMTAMRLAEHPTDDIWCAIPNPMAGLG